MIVHSFKQTLTIFYLSCAFASFGFLELETWKVMVSKSLGLFGGLEILYRTPLPPFSAAMWATQWSQGVWFCSLPGYSNIRKAGKAGRLPGRTGRTLNQIRSYIHYTGLLCIHAYYNPLLTVAPHGTLLQKQLYYWVTSDSSLFKTLILPELSLSHPWCE
jgi:hypothetical protein